ncbi:MAG: tyrosine-type recombinase/integrase [Limisphaerales bacterium]
MHRDELPELVQRFFAHYLVCQRDLSMHTRNGYRDTFRLFLSFLSQRSHRPIDQLTLDALNPESILAFLDHLETTRSNTARTRNLRLAAIRTFVRFVLGEEVGVNFIGIGHRILAIPQKKSPKRVLGFMTREEIDAVLAATDPATRSGQRDRLLFTLLYNTGARISEALQLRTQDLLDRAVHLRGKGRRDRTVPVWPATERLLRQWCKTNHLAPEQLIFTNRNGEPLSRDGVAFRLALSVRKAALHCPSLSKRRITCHTFRHACAMSLLQAGVALEVIALWLGHAKPLTTHGYIEADLKMKADCLKRLTEPTPPRRRSAQESSRLLAFLEAI